MLGRIINVCLLVTAIAVTAGCQTVGVGTTHAPENWSGYNSPDRLRIDALVVDRNDAIVERVQRARSENSEELFAKLGLEAFGMMQDGDADRVNGCVPLRIEFTNPGVGGPFFAYSYADSDNPTHPVRVESVSEDPDAPAVFTIEACHGYGSLDVPYSYIRQPTFAEVGVPDTDTFYPRSGATLLGPPGELYGLVEDNQQYSLWLVVLN